ncbi:uncharacterized protein LOC144451943 [Glandiceps talaboti]
MSDKKYLLGENGDRQEGQTQSTGAGPLFHDSSQSPRARMLQLAFAAVVTLMVLLALALSIYRCAYVGEVLYILLGLSLLGFALIQGILIYFVRSGDLSKGKTWFFYFTGFCTILEAIFTCVLVFD